MNKILLSGILLLVSSVSLASPLKAVSKDDYGDKWAFTSDEVQLQCIDGGAFVMDYDTNNVYAISGLANQLAKKGKYPADDINGSSFWKENPDMPGAKISLAPFITDALALCGK
ncbi:DUF2511 domain-containing protein [Morganella morganii subsp. morganii]|uniref:DUF2511 domain-containing protein n=1 Tax=Morganella morganii TaxID=582 RepID=UPI001BDB4F11|nr:DUF2511 domain-containing protein [Morganella morganii]MBT0375278.1 DUF2511 domain-containing protein [Morganella morganii subsp. morganii]HBL6967342.1 DUF2511 domain-containing protein [Morganella morganii]